jgi:ATP-dependent Clp endopeptidase proteolytic subunit ClpP
MPEDKAVLDRTDEEKAANAARLQAESKKALAEAAAAKADARVSVAAARSAEARADQDELKLALVLEGERKRKTSDEEHRIYRFYDQVGPATVEKAIVTLTEWHRLDPEGDIEIIFNSPGGSIIDGFELFDFLVDLANRGHIITTGCTGMAASMAGILMQAGTRRWMSRESWYMIHQAGFMAMGKTFDVKDQVEWVERIQARILKIFAERSTLTVKKIKANWDRKDWWIDSDEALKYQLVDEVRASSLPSEKAEEPEEE